MMRIMLGLGFMFSGAPSCGNPQMKLAAVIISWESEVCGCM